MKASILKIAPPKRAGRPRLIPRLAPDEEKGILVFLSKEINAVVNEVVDGLSSATGPFPAWLDPGKLFFLRENFEGLPLITTKRVKSVCGMVRANPRNYLAMSGRQEAVMAYDRVFCASQPLVRNMAKRNPAVVGRRLGVDDAMGYGNEGLANAIGRYDPSREASFRTFAYFHIRTKMNRGTMRDRAVRISENAALEVSRHERIVRRIMSSTGMSYRQAAVMAMGELDGRESEPSSERLRFLEETRTAGACPLSLDGSPTGRDGDSYYERFRPSQVVSDPIRVLEDREDAIRLLAGLKPKERDVMTMLYGLNGVEEVTLVQACQLLGCSRSVLERLHLTALNKMRQRSQSP